MSGRQVAALFVMSVVLLLVAAFLIFHRDR